MRKINKLKCCLKAQQKSALKDQFAPSTQKVRRNFI